VRVKELYESAHSILTGRSVWENKQRLFYQMRHDGIRRQKKPFPGAADGHYPMVDMAIRKAKPFWMGQVTSGDKLAVFTSLKPNDLSSFSDSAADYFDFILTQKSQFLRKLRVAVDHMLLRGRGSSICAAASSTCRIFSTRSLLHISWYFVAVGSRSIILCFRFCALTKAMQRTAAKPCGRSVWFIGRLRCARQPLPAAVADLFRSASSPRPVEERGIVGRTTGLR